MMPEPIKPASKIIKSSMESTYASDTNIKTIAPRIVGMLSKKANLEESLRFKPTSSAPVMAIPDREAPGKTAKA